MKKLAILGSTGSIGRQSLEVVRANKELFSITALAAGSNVNLLEEMTQLLMTQRAYQLSTKAVGSADEMLQVINEIL